MVSIRVVYAIHSLPQAGLSPVEMVVTKSIRSMALHASPSYILKQSLRFQDVLLFQYSGIKFMKLLFLTNPPK